MLELPVGLQNALQPKPPSDYHQMKAFVASQGGRWAGLKYPALPAIHPHCPPSASRPLKTRRPRRTVRHEA